MTENADLAAEIERRVRELGCSPAPTDDAISLGYYVAGQVQQLLAALRAPRPEPAGDVVEAVAALKGLLLFFALPGETSIERFERCALAYRRETGRLAPGKDSPMGGSDMEPAERYALFDAWVQSKVSAALAAAQEAPTPSRAEREQSS
jgi:hypothetical protein